MCPWCFDAQILRPPGLQLLLPMPPMCPWCFDAQVLRPPGLQLLLSAACCWTLRVCAGVWKRRHCDTSMHMPLFAAAPYPSSECFLVLGSADTATPECTCRCLLLPPTPLCVFPGVWKRRQCDTRMHVPLFAVAPYPSSECFLVFGSADTATPVCTCCCLLLPLPLSVCFLVFTPPTPLTPYLTPPYPLSVCWCLDAQTLRPPVCMCCCLLLPPLPLPAFISPRPTL
jgi:hypothetical protein